MQVIRGMMTDLSCQFSESKMCFKSQNIPKKLSWTRWNMNSSAKVANEHYLPLPYNIFHKREGFGGAKGVWREEIENGRY